MLEKDFDAIHDLRFKIQISIFDTPYVASRLAFDCAPKGLLVGLPVNGQRVSFAENVFYEFRDEKIQQVWSIIDKGAIAVFDNHSINSFDDADDSFGVQYILPGAQPPLAATRFLVRMPRRGFRIKSEGGQERGNICRNDLLDAQAITESVIPMASACAHRFVS